MASESSVGSSPSSLLYPYLRHNQPEEQAEDEEEIIFCTEDNVTEAAIYINQELEVFGFQSIMSDSDKENKEVPSSSKMLNTLYDLIKQYRESNNRNETMSLSLQRLRSDLTLQYEANSRMKTQIEELERKLAQAKEKERQVLSRNRSLSLQLKSQEEEYHKVQHRMSQKELQYEHELRKKEREYHRLNERLGQLVLNKNQEKKLGMKLLNTLQVSSSSRGGGGGVGGARGFEDISAYRLVVNHYEEKQKELILENSSLRDSLCNMEKELVTLLNYKYFSSLSSPSHSFINKAEEEVESSVHEREREELLDSGHYQMPYDIVRQDIEENLRDKYDRLREYIVSLKKGHASSSSESYDKEIEDLEKKLSDYRDIISQQELLLEKQLEESSSDPGGAGFLNESKFLKKEEMLVLREEKNKNHEEHLKNEEERLGLLARQLDRERRNFEDKKATFLTQQLDSSVFATPGKTTSDLDSFFLRLNSTPFSLSTRKPSHKKSSHYTTPGPSGPPRSILKPLQTPYTPLRSTGRKPSPPPFVNKSIVTPFKSKVSPTDVPTDIDLKQDLSLTSDDGLEVLND
ncbi:PREDICTED: afadin- and alpha-actinin-binding protein-like isoform X1 [Amphimedon queenslandica]|uniref:Uncharacterized protein n=1 Tax=Amphimedon queenslandica TaxID=400682 RepID=A0A1X7UCJ9_AMPQE|nr:PREDICTED: afadin- and alpha-actinin-binding protein-like isoform X1 [Amphimedon queenslandica]|eukprot:XP_019855052.1 PREDICTED: afadin- and alpha-actinin-binding protein-like isoform X1 [Amphimedon queenslandica]